jgi:hypothetical protein
MRLYRYVGPKSIAERVDPTALGVPIRSPQDVFRWVRETGQKADADDLVIATFIIGEAGLLRVADRRSEHVACAGGGPVQSAGEITFALGKGKAGVAAVSNQSTGFCPEPESWPAVEATLRLAGLSAPDGFSPACAFRHCPKCGGINVVKDAVFECGVCGTPLPEAWNCDSGPTSAHPVE